MLASSGRPRFRRMCRGRLKIRSRSQPATGWVISLALTGQAMPPESLHCAQLPFAQRKGPRDAPRSCQVQSAQRPAHSDASPGEPELGQLSMTNRRVVAPSSPPSRGAAEEEMAICRCRHLSASALRHREAAGWDWELTDHYESLSSRCSWPCPAIL